MTIDAEKYQVTESVYGTFHYHLSLTTPSGYVRGLCGSQTMLTQIPVTAWGHVGHLNERYCPTCVYIATEEHKT